MNHPRHHAAVKTAEAVVGGRVNLARALRVRTSAVGNWLMRGVPIAQCVAIERVTDGAVTRRDLRPDDWRDIWPELVQSTFEQNQPEVTANKARAATETEVQESA